MGDSSQPSSLPQQQRQKKKRREGDVGLLLNNEEDGDEEEAGCGGEGRNELRLQVWQTFRSSFRQVQTVLDQNRVLINQVNENHQSKIPDNLTKNVALIREINSNVAKVVSLYSDLSSNFADFFHSSSSSGGGDGVDSGKAC
ncbi:hypothetical protein ACLOJK_016645 [Asimina triloba]